MEPKTNLMNLIKSFFFKFSYVINGFLTATLYIHSPYRLIAVVFRVKIHQKEHDVQKLSLRFQPSHICSVRHTKRRPSSKQESAPSPLSQLNGSLIRVKSGTDLHP